ncbi:MAG: CD225/dispanin family protein [Pedobacter sp.]|nr:MAG: CD225/dispanin family protein [Pedobacter sp.]
MPGIRPKNWLIESILVTLFCCLPFGIAGIVNAANVNNRYDAGDYAGAVAASEAAGKWTKIGFFISIGLYVLFAILGFLGFFGALLSDVNY